jgi:hypothetical protein
MKDKSNQQEKDTKEGPNLQVAGPGGEITAGICAIGCIAIWQCIFSV